MGDNLNLFNILIKLSYIMQDKKHNVRANWRTCQVPIGLVIQIEEFLKTDAAKRIGINTVSGYIAYSLRKTLDI